MIGHSLPEYIFIRTSIFALRLIAPLSIAYLCASWYSGSWVYSRWLGYYAVVEATFYLGVYLPRSYLLQQVSLHFVAIMVCNAQLAARSPQRTPPHSPAPNARPSLRNASRQHATPSPPRAGSTSRRPPTSVAITSWTGSCGPCSPLLQVMREFTNGKMSWRGTSRLSRSY